MQRWSRPLATVDATQPLGTHHELTSASQSSSARRAVSRNDAEKLAAPAHRTGCLRRLSGAPAS
jgi:hypothetical protein